MKRMAAFALALCLLLTLTACSKDETSKEEIIGGPDSKVLVAYFSLEGNTARVGEDIAMALHGDSFAIVPEQPYTAAETDSNDDTCRAKIEQTTDARPPYVGGVDNFDDYDIIFIGYPIWWGDAPKIISTFLESYDFTNKTLIPFCTSHTSGLGTSASDLHPLAESARWLDGKRFPSGAARRTVLEWVDGLHIQVADK